MGRVWATARFSGLPLSSVVLEYAYALLDLAFVIILHAILHTRSHHSSLRAAFPDIPKMNLRALGL
jgi:hypothetical protein